MVNVIKYGGIIMEKNNEFSPVRKVGNRHSRKVPHLKGSFFSFKLDKVIEYESLSESIFYLFLELNQNVSTYYPQPLKIKVPYFTEGGEVCFWDHVPDVLVFWGMVDRRPTLYQIKYKADTADRKQQLINNSCKKYTKEKNWIYKVVEIEGISKCISKNMQFIFGHLKERKYYKEITPIIEQIVAKREVTSIHDVIKSLESQYSEMFIIPTLYHLIAKGVLLVDLTEIINDRSMIRLGSITYQLEENFKGVDIK